MALLEEKSSNPSLPVSCLTASLLGVRGGSILRSPKCGLGGYERFRLDPAEDWFAKAETALWIWGSVRCWVLCGTRGWAWLQVVPGARAWGPWV